MPNLYWPHRRLFASRSLKERKRLARWRQAEKSATSTLAVSHAHCLDGVAAAVVAERTLSGVGVLYAQPGDMVEVLEFVARHPGRDRQLLVSDLSLQREQFDAVVSAAARVRAQGWRIAWRDHHHKQWEGLDLDRLRRELEVLEVNDDATESGASMQQKALAPKDPYLKSLAEKVRDRDLWWNKDPDSETLEFALTRLGPRRLGQHLRQAPGDGPVVDEVIRKAAEEERDRQQAILGRLLQQAREWGEGGSRVAVVYGWLPKNTGLHELIEKGCRIAINVRPNGKVSLRSAKGADVCHKVAQQFNGGGHPNASGADLGLKGPGFWWYVLRRGRVPVVERMAMAAVRELEALGGGKA